MPPSARAGRGPSAGSRDLGLRPCFRAPALDEPDDAGRGLLDREIRDLDHRAAEPPLDVLGLLELGVDLEQLRVCPLVAAEPCGPLAPDLLEPVGGDSEADYLGRGDVDVGR